MGRRSSIERLKPAQREPVDRLRREDGATIEEITQALARAGAKVSRSAVGRYIKKMTDREEGLNDFTVGGISLASAVFGAVRTASTDDQRVAEALRDVILGEMKVLRSLKRLQIALRRATESRQPPATSEPAAISASQQQKEVNGL